MHPRRRENLIEATLAGQAVPVAQRPKKYLHHSQRPTEAEFRRFRELEKIRDRHAHELLIDPTLIAPKSVLGDLARDWEIYAPALMVWQRALLQAD
jgi:hypothetical protein